MNIFIPLINLLYCYFPINSNYNFNSLTNFALAMPENCIIQDDNWFTQSVNSYRNYYIKEKQHIAKWTNRNTPEWFIKSN